MGYLGGANYTKMSSDTKAMLKIAREKNLKESNINGIPWRWLQSITRFENSNL